MLAPIKNDHPDPEPPWKREPWWHGKATRDHVLAGFMFLMLLTSLAIFVTVVWLL